MLIEVPTINHIPAIAASHPPSIAVARLRLVRSRKPPTKAPMPGSTSIQNRAQVQCHVTLGVYAKLKYGPTNGISAAQIPHSMSKKPPMAPLDRGIRQRP